MARFFVTLTGDEERQLANLAFAARRGSREHASWLLAEAIRRERARIERETRRRGQPQQAEEGYYVAPAG